MNLRFRPLFTVGTSHAYYNDDTTAGRDVDFFVPDETRDALRGGRLLARELDGMLHVLYEADENDAPVSDIAGQTLYFGVCLNNPYFGNFSTPVIAEPGLTPLYANATSPGALNAAIGVQLVAGLYAHVPQETNRPLTLSLADRNGNTVLTQVLATTGAAAAFDLRALPSGVWTMTEDYGNSLVHHRTILLDPDLRDRGVWGVLAIEVAAAFYAAPAAYTLNFTPRQETLKYYIVASKFGPTEFDQLGVVDAGFVDEARAEVKFDKVLPAAFTPADFAPSLLGDEGDGSTRIVLFRSQTPIARRERGLRKIHLQRNGDILIEHLPQPSADRSQAQLIIHLSKP